MKLSKKIIGYLASASILATTATTIVACGSSNPFTPTPEHDDPGWDVDVYYDVSQSKTFNVNDETFNSFNVGNFRLSRTLGAFEEVMVKSTNPEHVSLVGDGGYIPHPAGSFSLETKINSLPEDNVTYKFGYIFEFYQDNILMSTKRIDNFTVKYTKTVTSENTISWALNDSLDKQFQLSDGKKTIEISGFKLGRAIDTSINEKVILTVLNQEGGRQFSISEPSINGTSLSTTVTFKNAEEWIAQNSSFQISCQFHDDIHGTYPQQPIDFGSFVVYPKAIYVAPKIEVHHLNDRTSIDFQTEKGFTGIYCDSWNNSREESTDVFFTLDRHLAENERVVVFSSNPKEVSAVASISSGEWQKTEEEFLPLIDLTVNMTNVIDPFKSGIHSEFFLTFGFYEDNELKAVQDLTFPGTDEQIPFNISYEPLDNPTEDPDDYGITFAPVVVDSSGTAVFNFVGKVARENDPTGQAGLQPGDYLTIQNTSLCEPVLGREAGETRNLFVFSLPENSLRFERGGDYPQEGIWFDDPTAKVEGTGQIEIPFQVKWLSVDIETLQQQDNPPVPEWYELGEPKFTPSLFNSIFDFISKIKVSFYDANDKLINNQTSQIDFLFYPPGFWNGTSDEVIDQWIANRSLLLVCEYDDDITDTRKRIEGTIWLSYLDRAIDYWWKVITSWDVINELKYVFNENHDNKWMEEHNVKMSLGLPNSGSTYNIKNFDTHKYLSDKDMLTFKPYRKADGSFPEEHCIKLPEQQPFTWNDEKTQGSSVGAFLMLDIAYIIQIFSLGGREEPDPTDIEALNNFLILINDVLPWYYPLLFGTEDLPTDVDGEKYITNCQGLTDETKTKGTLSPITNWDAIKTNYSNAVISGFSSKQLNIDGQNKLVYYWTTRKVDFSAVARPSYKRPEDAIGQFDDLTDNVKHESYAYELPDSYSTNPDDENGWFSSAGRGAMMVVRQWTENEDGESIIDIPRVAGINWNGGVQSNIGPNMFKPWIDLFWYRDDNINKNLIQDYLKPCLLLSNLGGWYEK